MPHVNYVNVEVDDRWGPTVEQVKRSGISKFPKI